MRETHLTTNKISSPLISEQKEIVPSSQNHDDDDDGGCKIANGLKDRIMRREKPSKRSEGQRGRHLWQDDVLSWSLTKLSLHPLRCFLLRQQKKQASE